MRRYTRMLATLLATAGVSSAVSAQTAPVAPTGILSGRVLIDVSAKALSEVEIFFPDLALKALSDEKGLFRISGVPVGVHTVRARKIGYAQFEARLQFKDGDKTDVAIVLPVVNALDSVKVVGASTLPLSYYEHQLAGLGRFITRDQLDQNKNNSIVNAVSQMSGLGMIRGRGNQGWPVSKRVTVSLGVTSPVNRSGPIRAPEGFYQPDTSEIKQGMKVACYARVYLGKMLLNGGRAAEPVDLNEYAPSTVEAIEYFASASQVPIEYSRLGSNCGVLVLHQRKRN